MKKQIYISVPQPCYEHWDKMHRTSDGAFCQSCQKNVIDFTGKTENEIYELVTNSKEKLCGRFATHQLDQPIRKTELKNGFMKWRAYAAGAVAFISAEKITANGNTGAEQFIQTPIMLAALDTAVAKGEMDSTNLNRSSEVNPSKVDLAMIRGKVIDADSKEELNGAIITLKHSGRSAITDGCGNFSLPNDTTTKNDTLIVSYIGYAKQEFPLSNFALMDGIVELKLTEILMGTMGIFIVKHSSEDFDYDEGEDLLKRYDPRQDIRKSVRNRAKEK